MNAVKVLPSHAENRKRDLGLPYREARKRLTIYGKNKLERKRKSPGFCCCLISLPILWCWCF